MGELKLTWSDCGAGATHTKITGFTPATITTGQKTKMTGTGDLDEDVSGANFDLEMKTAAGTVSCKGDASASKTCNLPLGTGSLTFDAITFPLKKGSTSITVDLSLSAALPGALAHTDTKTSATAANGDQLFCMEIKSAPATELSEAASCTGSGDPAAGVCYAGAAGFGPLKEKVKVDLKSFASAKGTMSLTGSGIQSITCADHSFTKSGQDIKADLSDCLPDAITVESVKYCSDKDQVAVTVKDKTVPIPITATLSKVTCGADMWKKYKEDYGISFNGQDEDDKRFAVFMSNVDLIQETNEKNLGFELGINQFAHLSAEEFSAQYTGLKMPENVWGDLPYLGRHNCTGASLADSVDWTSKDKVTPVKNQGHCGSCWAFSTTGSLEGAHALATGKLVALSEQQFVDCDKKVDQGCKGGLMDNAFAYAEANAICTEDSYKYTGVGGSCKASTCTVGLPKGSVTGYKDVAKNDMNAMMEAVAQQPVSIAIQANLPTFLMYKNGVLGGVCGAA